MRTRCRRRPRRDDHVCGEVYPMRSSDIRGNQGHTPPSMISRLKAQPFVFFRRSLRSARRMRRASFPICAWDCLFAAQGLFQNCQVDHGSSFLCAAAVLQTKGKLLRFSQQSAQSMCFCLFADGRDKPQETKWIFATTRTNHQEIRFCQQT